MVSRFRNPWRRISSRVVYQTPWFRVREDAVVTPTGQRGLYAFLDYPGSVGIVAVNARREVAIIREWNYPTHRWVWGIPSGGRQRGFSPLHDARRELLEETGLKAKRWRRLAIVGESPGLTNDIKYIFLARTLSGKLVPQTAEAIQQVRFFPWRRVRAMIKRGDLAEAGSVVAILLAEQYL